MLKGIIAISKDGYVARSETDNMRWLGSTDKAIFRILTSSGGGIMGTSLKTAKLMPLLTGRELRSLSRKIQDGDALTHDLEWFYNKYKNAWLIGGQDLLFAALAMRYVKEIYICRSNRYAFPEKNKGIPDLLTDYLIKYWHLALETEINDVIVECWRNLA